MHTMRTIPMHRWHQQIVTIGQQWFIHVDGVTHAFGTYLHPLAIGQ